MVLHMDVTITSETFEENPNTDIAVSCIDLED